LPQLKERVVTKDEREYPMNADILLGDFFTYLIHRWEKIALVRSAATDLYTAPPISIRPIKHKAKADPGSFGR
jgi:hypothetical protein